MSWRPTLGKGNKPKYLALVEALENDIASGALQHGDRLPPQRNIAEQLDVTIATITRAIQEAIRRGIVTARTGSGTFVRVTGSEAAAERPLPDLSLNTLPTGPSKTYLDEALKELGNRMASDVLCVYEPSAGSERHRTSMATWLRKRRLIVSPSQIFITHGGQHALAACFYALTRPGDSVLCEQWTYSGIARLAALSHVRAVGVRMNAGGLDPGSLKQRLKGTKAKILFCTAAAQNPTASTMSLTQRREILSICKKEDVLVVEDDIGGMLSGDPLPALAALEPSQVVYISSLSKCLAPGIRIGSIAAPESVMANLQNALVALQWTAPAFWAELFTWMLENGTAEKCVVMHRREAVRRLGIYAEIMRTKIASSLPSYHVWQKIPSTWRSDDFVTELMSLGVKISPSRHFSVSGNDDNHHVRICLGGGDDPVLLKDQLVKIRAVMSGRPRSSATII